MSPARVPAAVLATLLVALLATACFGQPSKSVVRNSDTTCLPEMAYGGANAAAVPASFPTDFPVYPGSTFAAAVTSGKRINVTWTSAVAIKKILAFYEKQLQAGDWQLFADQGTDPCGAWWHVERRSDSHYGGWLQVYSRPSDNGITYIYAIIGKK
jgi:hypothetical protein